MANQKPDDSKSYAEVIGVHETFEFQWTIPNWEKVRIDESLVNNQKVTVESSQHAKWVIGLKSIPCGSGHRSRVYWKLVEINGHDNLDVIVSTHLLDRGGAVQKTDEKRKIVSLNEIIEESSEYLDVVTRQSVDEAFICSDGSIKYKLKLVIKFPTLASDNFIQMHKRDFSNKSLKQLCDNQASLLTNESIADLKIVTRDGSMIRAHKAILLAQCPVFAGMLSAEFCENTSGVVKLDDISEKAMKILLKYFYTGNLSPTWCDSDTIVEFVYAAGKYQMRLVLDLLDNTLGRDSQSETCYVDVQLLNLTERLSLKHAEKRILERVVEKVTIAKTSQDLFELLGYSSEDVKKEAKSLASQMLGESNVFENLDALLREHDNNEQQNGMGKTGLQLLAVMQSKNGKGKVTFLEKMLLDCYAKTVKGFTSAEELFLFFGYTVHE